MTNELTKWLKLATPNQQILLAKLAKTSRAYLHHIATRRKRSGPETADAIALASHNPAFKGLPLLRKEYISPACARCEYAKKVCA
jgi:hypothetical protein